MYGQTFELIPLHINRICGVMVGMLASRVMNPGFGLRQVKPKTIKLVFVAPPPSMHH